MPSILRMGLLIIIVIVIGYEVEKSCFTDETELYQMKGIRTSLTKLSLHLACLKKIQNINIR